LKPTAPHGPTTIYEALDLRLLAESTSILHTKSPLCSSCDVPRTSGRVPCYYGHWQFALTLRFARLPFPHAVLRNGSHNLIFPSCVRASTFATSPLQPLTPPCGCPAPHRRLLGFPFHRCNSLYPTRPRRLPAASQIITTCSSCCPACFPTAELESVVKPVAAMAPAELHFSSGHGRFPRSYKLSVLHHLNVTTPSIGVRLTAFNRSRNLPHHTFVAADHLDHRNFHDPHPAFAAPVSVCLPCLALCKPPSHTS